MSQPKPTLSFEGGPLCNNDDNQVGLNGCAMPLTLHNQGHTQVSPISLNKPKCGVHGTHPTTIYPNLDNNKFRARITPTHNPRDIA